MLVSSVIILAHTQLSLSEVNSVFYVVQPQISDGMLTSRPPIFAECKLITVTPVYNSLTCAYQCTMNESCLYYVTSYTNDTCMVCVVLNMYTPESEVTSLSSVTIHRKLCDPNIKITSESRLGVVKFNGNSYMLYNSVTWPRDLGSTYTIVVHFKTIEHSGVLFFAAGNSHNFFGGFIKDGLLYHKFDNGNWPINVSSSIKVDDGHWHQATFTKNIKTVTLDVDGVELTTNTASTGGNHAGTNGHYYIGGLPTAVQHTAQQLIVSTFDILHRIFLMCFTRLINNQQ